MTAIAAHQPLADRALARFLGWMLLLAALVVGIAWLAWTDRLVSATVAALAMLVLLAGLRFPLAPLMLLAALVPIEDLATLGPVGTASKLAAILLVVTYALPRLTRLRLSAMPVAGWGYVAWAVLSTAWAVNTDVALTALLTLVQLFLVAVLVADIVANRPSIIRPLFWTYTISAGITAFVALEAYLVGGGRAGAFEAQGQDVDQFAVTLLPALLFAFHELVEGRAILVSGFFAALTSTGILISGARGAWVAAAIGLVVYLVPRMNVARLLVVGLAAAGILVASFQVPGVADLVAERTSTAVQTGGSGRTAIWEAGVRIYASEPVSGVGYGNFPVSFTSELAADVGSPYAGTGSHNVVIGTLGELGTIGLILFALFLTPLLLRQGWGPYGPMVQAVLASLMAAALFLDVLNHKHLWMVVGIAAGLSYVRGHPDLFAPLVPRAGRRAPARTGLPGPKIRPTTGTAADPRGVTR